MNSGKHWGTVFSSQMNLLNLDTVPQQHIFPCHGPVFSLCFTCGIKNIFMNTINAQLAISSKKGVGSIYIQHNDQDFMWLLTKCLTPIIQSGDKKYTRSRKNNYFFSIQVQYMYVNVQKQKAHFKTRIHLMIQNCETNGCVFTEIIAI